MEIIQKKIKKKRKKKGKSRKSWKGQKVENTKAQVGVIKNHLKNHVQSTKEEGINQER